MELTFTGFNKLNNVQQRIFLFIINQMVNFNGKVVQIPSGFFDKLEEIQDDLKELSTILQYHFKSPKTESKGSFISDINHWHKDPDVCDINGKTKLVMSDGIVKYLNRMEYKFSIPELMGTGTVQLEKR